MIRYHYPSWYFLSLECFQTLVWLGYEMKSYGVIAQLKPLWQTVAQRYLFLRTLEMNIF